MTDLTSGTTRGEVVWWIDDEGWGLLRSPEIPGEVFAHFSSIVEPPGSFRSLTPGERVAFSWERVPQSGYDFRAIHVSRGEVLVEPAAEEEPLDDQAAYTSELRVEYDQEP
ncbi:hypothetical protein Misp01_47690 [Microtetraspora sp. NBRC 13810]|uniref:cold-shock protein n=1 Tax=Microtetraspora sp. NBRC 13810 TaxID=3030990 RepID=UPI0024A5DF51|nr:cold shock domain-containing protein [Microtetraspora sp. NBRC 13810]GLW09640.1 hypothetical protein Misp01_47690 [Microtetraspora sp. NBRC 13810]